MAWIKTIPLKEADGELLEMMMKQRELYPAEYAASTAEQTGTEEVDSRVAHADPECAFSRIFNFRRVDVA